MTSSKHRGFLSVTCRAACLDEVHELFHGILSTTVVG